MNIMKVINPFSVRIYTLGFSAPHDSSLKSQKYPVMFRSAYNVVMMFSVEGSVMV